MPRSRREALRMTHKLCGSTLQMMPPLCGFRDAPSECVAPWKCPLGDGSAKWPRMPHQQGGSRITEPREFDSSQLAHDFTNDLARGGSPLRHDNRNQNDVTGGGVPRPRIQQQPNPSGGGVTPSPRPEMTMAHHNWQQWGDTNRKDDFVALQQS
jgi:hypothetical protein